MTLFFCYRNNTINNDFADNLKVKLESHNYKRTVYYQTCKHLVRNEKYVDS